MTIRRGEEWGTTVPRPEGLVIASSDADIARRLRAGPDAPIGVGGGDLHRALGAPGHRASVQRVPIDLLRVQVDGIEQIAVAHVVARRSWWRGPILAAMNVDHVGRWNVAPRAHPNDGRFDVVEVAPSMSVRDRWMARSRLPQGTHLPHPAITSRTATSGEWNFERAMRLWVDGEDRGVVHELAINLEPDAFELHL